MAIANPLQQAIQARLPAPPTLPADHTNSAAWCTYRDEWQIYPQTCRAEWASRDGAGAGGNCWSCLQEAQEASLRCWSCLQEAQKAYQAVTGLHQRRRWGSLAAALHAYEQAVKARQQGQLDQPGIDEWLEYFRAWCHYRQAWRDHWVALGQRWRFEPEIDGMRQSQLSACLATQPNIEEGGSPFKGVQLTRADVEWLLERHHIPDPHRQPWKRLSGWLENLPPFWTAYALTLTETIGAAVLALPIALAGVGPLAGVLILLVMGVINVLTIASMAEAVTRSGSMRYQGSYLGRLVQDYLGRAGSLLLTAMIVTFCFLMILAYYLGFSLTLAAATSVPAEVWACVLFLLGVYFVRRKTLQATVTSALMVGAINLGLILILCVLALEHLQLDHLLYVHVPFLGGRPFEPALLGLIFGVVFCAYFGHFSVNNCARTVLQRDPSGRALVWGCMAAQVTAMLLYILWVVAINGAIAPEALTGFSGTALVPLARLAGPAVNVFGTILVILAMGMASIHISLALFFTVREWLPPGQARQTLVLGRQQGTVRCTAPGNANASLTLTYLGLKGTHPQFRVDLQRDGDTHRFEVEVKTTWQAAPVLAEFAPHLPPKSLQLTVTIVATSAERVRMQLVTTMDMRYEANGERRGFDGPERAEVAEPPERAFVHWLTGREQVSAQEAAQFLHQSEQATQTLLNDLLEQGALVETRENGQTLYQLHDALRRQASGALWQARDEPGEVTTDQGDALQSRKTGIWLTRMQAVAQGEQARSWLGLSPLLLIFLLAEWLFVNKLESFSQVVSFVGIIAAAVLAGVFPVLLLLASRRKGEHVPGFVLPFLAHPAVAGGIYLLAVCILFLHGLFIWQNPFQRGMALLAGLVIVLITSLMVRKGAFARRLVIEVRQDPAEEGTGTFLVTDCGRYAPLVRVWLGYADSERGYQEAGGVIPAFAALCWAKFSVPNTQAQELMVRVHRVTPQGQSEPLPALLKVRMGKHIQEVHVDGANRQVVLPLGDVGKKASKGSPVAAGQLEVEVQLANPANSSINNPVLASIASRATPK